MQFSPTRLPGPVRRSHSGLRTPVLVALLTTVLLGLIAPAAGAAAPAQAQPPGTGWLRIAHLVPGFGAVRVDLQPAQGGTGRSIEMSPSAVYGKVSEYSQYPAQPYLVTVRPSGAATSAQPMLSRTFTVASGQAYTLAVLGTRQAPRLAALTDDLTPPSGGDARVRILPASNAAPTVSVTAAGGPTLVDDAVLGQVTPYAAVPGGVWKLDVMSGSQAVAASTVRVIGGNVYTLLVLDGSTRPRLQLITDAAGMTTAPQGGAATGAGGTATVFSPSGRESDGQPELPWAAGALAALTLVIALAAGACWGARRRLRVPRQSAGRG